MLLTESSLISTGWGGGRGPVLLHKKIDENENDSIDGLLRKLRMRINNWMKVVHQSHEFQKFQQVVAKSCVRISSMILGSWIFKAMISSVEYLIKERVLSILIPTSTKTSNYWNMGDNYNVWNTICVTFNGNDMNYSMVMINLTSSRWK